MARQYKTNEVKVDLASYRHYWRGEKKVGKTTLFYDLMMKLYGDPSYGLELSVGNERGFKAIDGMVYDEAPNWETLIEIVDDLIENKADNHFKFICFDTVDELVEIAKKEVIRLDKKKTGTLHSFNACFGGYGEPRQKVQSLINNIMTRLEDAGYAMIWIGHTKYKDVKEKNGDSYQLLTSNLSSDYDGIFADKADICMMINVEKDIDDGIVQGSNRYMWFRGDGFVDCGGRFPDIEQKVDFSVDNYVRVVSEAIKKSIKSKKVDDKYIAEKAKQEQEEKERYYNEHKEDLMEEDSIAVSEKKEEFIKELKTKIKEILSDLSSEDKQAKRKALKEAGLPDQWSKITDVDVLNKILKVVSE